MMNSILGNHSRILGLQELHFIDRYWRPGKARRWGIDKAATLSSRLVATARRSIWDSRPIPEDEALARKALCKIDVNGLDAASVYERTLAILLAESGHTFVTDQTPRNVYLAEALLERFPAATVIQMIRDPRAVLLSQKNRWRQRGLGAMHIPARNAIRVFVNYHPITASKLWLRAYEAGKGALNHPRFMRVKFEEFVSSPRDSAMRLCQRIRVDFEAKMLEVPRVGSSNVPHDWESRGISGDVVDTWRSELSRADTWICQKLIGSVFDEVGYARVDVGLPALGIAWRVIGYPFHLVAVLITNPLLAIRVIRSAVITGSKSS